MLKFFTELSSSDKIQFITAMITLFGVLVSIVVAVVTALQNKKLLEENTRPNIEIYKDIIDIKRIREYIVIKNFGNSTAYISNLTFDKDLIKLTNTKYKFDNNVNLEMLKSLEYMKEATLAPKQSYKIPIKSDKCELDKIQFYIEYKGLNKTYKETKIIYLKQDLNVVIFKDGENLWKNAKIAEKDTIEALTYVSNSLQEIIRKHT